MESPLRRLITNGDQKEDKSFGRVGIDTCKPYIKLCVDICTHIAGELHLETLDKAQKPSTSSLQPWKLKPRSKYAKTLGVL